MDAPRLARLHELRREVARHDELYYRKAAPEIGDFEYDRLKRELADLEAQLDAGPHAELPGLAAATASSPTRRVGDDRAEGFVRVRHRQAMMTLDNTYDEGELREFHARLVRLLGTAELTYTVEPKVDGVALSLTYERGELVRAVTRGDGEEGDDVTANIRTLAGLPTRLRPAAAAPLPLFAETATEGEGSFPDRIEIRGEVYLTWGEFERINQLQEEAGLPRYANPRNLAAGTLKQLDPALVAQRRLQIVLYGQGACEPASAAAPSQSSFQRQLVGWGLPVLERWWLARGIEEAWAAVRELDGLRRSFAYATDGAVVKLDSAELQRSVGARGEGESARKLSPRWAVAYKFAPDRAETRLHAITLQVGRTGVLTPVAELDPVHLAGTTVARATLHNADEIARKDVRVGDTVVVEKAGEIIPAVVGVVLTRRPADAVPFAFPSCCPACGAAAVRAEGEVAWRCANPDCPEKLRRRLTHFAAKACLDIEGLGEEVADLLVERGLVRTLPDLFRLRLEELLPLKKSGEVWAGNLIAAIQARRRCELWRLLHGLGIPQVGAAAAKDLARAFGSISRLEQAGAEQLMAVDNIGEKTAGILAAWFADPDHRRLIGELTAAGVEPVAPAGADAGEGPRPLAGQTFVLTGTMPGWPREAAQAEIEAAGGRVVGSVSRKTRWVVAGEDAGSKLDKARALGLPVLDAAALRRLLSGEPVA